MDSMKLLIRIRLIMELSTNSKMEMKSHPHKVPLDRREAAAAHLGFLILNLRVNYSSSSAIFLPALQIFISPLIYLIIGGLFDFHLQFVEKGLYGIYLPILLKCF